VAGSWDGGWRRYLLGAAVGVAALVAVSAVVYALRSFAPVLSLGVLYLFAVLPMAVLWGFFAALCVSVASLLVFNFLFLPPLHTFNLRDSENWVALAVYLVTALVVSELAARSRRRSAEAHEREREAAALAEVSALLLEAESVQAQLGRIGAHLARVLGSSHGRIELGSLRRPEATESVHELNVAHRSVGRLFLDRDMELSRTARERMLPALASALAVASEREQLARRALEAETLRRSDAIKTAVLRAVSHDLRSPLTAIRAAGDGLASPSLELDEAARNELLETIAVETRRLERLVANLLDLSRLEAGAARPRPEVWALDTLIASALEEVGADAGRVDVEAEEDLPPVWVDGAQIGRVLANLLENALKFTPAPQRVGVTAARGSGGVTVRVVDSGPGLANGDAERIFEPFVRGRGSGSGSGLGLAIARGFAQVNGSGLSAQSEPGRGATFVLTLPSAAPSVAALA
jgi:two-component system, OmpR family, sensor histidine kinase KdpD